MKTSNSASNNFAGSENHGDSSVDTSQVDGFEFALVFRTIKKFKGTGDITSSSATCGNSDFISLKSFLLLGCKLIVFGLSGSHNKKKIKKDLNFLYFTTNEKKYFRSCLIN
jgi:hypothetical protein